MSRIPLRIALLGDVMLGRSIERKLSNSDYSGIPLEISAASLWGPTLTSYLKTATVRIANLEACLVPAGTLPTKSQKAFKFLAEENHGIAALKAIDINAVSLANNHIGDADIGFVSTPLALDSAGIAHSGAGPDAAAAWKPSRFIAIDGRVAPKSTRPGARASAIQAM